MARVMLFEDYIYFGIIGAFGFKDDMTARVCDSRSLSCILGSSIESGCE